MNIIEQLGGYEETKKHLDSCWCDDDDRAYLLEKLLEYRRQHNIFEEGDWVVLLHTNYRSDVFALTKSFKEIYDEKGVVYRHATHEEIAAGRRL